MPAWPPEVQDRVAAAARVSLFLDYDGTLSPIVPDPAEAWLNPAMRDALAGLARKNEIVTTIMSGRAIDDLRVRVNQPNFTYAGNRGLEISGPQVEFVQPVAAARSAQLLEITDLLASRFFSVPGVLVEFKGLTSTVHYRRAADANATAIERCVREVVAPFEAQFEVDRGARALDIIPRTGWHKGCTVAWINERLGLRDALCIYCGDAKAGEDAAFASLPRGSSL